MLDHGIPGSHISGKAVSETKVTNVISLDIGGKQWLLVDTPGFGDTEGPMDNIVNAVSIAKVSL